MIEDSADTSDTTEVQITQRSTVEATLPSGVTAGQMAAAIKVDVCDGEPACDVVAFSTNSSTGRRRASSGKVSFDVTRTIDSSSNVSLAAPAVDGSALVDALGLPEGTSIDATSTLESVEALVTVISESAAGADGSSVEAQEALSALEALPAALATSLGVDFSAFTVVESPALIRPPAPPPKSPPPPSPMLPPPRSPVASSPPTPTIDLAGEQSQNLNQDVEPNESGSSTTLVIIIIVASASGAAMLLIGSIVFARRRRRAQKQADVPSSPRVTKHSTKDVEAVSAADGATKADMEDDLLEEVQAVKQTEEYL